MRIRTLIVLLISHAVLLVLASTNFSVVSWIWGESAWSWSCFQYSFRNGWGHTYVSEYGLGQVLCYIGAYGLGVAAFAIARVRLRLGFSTPAIIVCLLGAASFGIELTHWLWPHHLSLIASFPEVMVILWVIVGAQLGRISRRGTLSLRPFGVQSYSRPV